MNSTLKKIYSLIPAPLKNLQNNLRIKDRLLLAGKSRRESKTIKDIQAKILRGEKINVAFMAMSVSFWKYDDVFKLMEKDNHYNPVVIQVRRPEDTEAIQEMHQQKMDKFFSEKGYRNLHNIDELRDFNPDIIFYAQPYKNSVLESFRAYNFLDKLLCYVPYAFFVSNYTWAYDAQVHNLAWKLFYPSELHKENAIQIALNKGKNVDVVGYPLADRFITPAVSDPWKLKDRCIKRIVWGVHHSIFSNDLADVGTFLVHAQSMLDRARKSTTMQFAFKPHPHLKEHLYKHPDWGKERTDAYYAAWNEAPNTFLVDGDYIDLFKTSDALIHDCGSFTVEYLYMNKPVLFIGNNQDKILCNFGKMAHNANYHLNDYDIDNFLLMVQGKPVKSIDGKQEGDFRESLRKDAVANYLLPPNGKSFAQNILDILNETLIK